MSKETTPGSKDLAEPSPSQLIDARIRELNDWRGETLARVRSLITEAAPEAVEEWKWRGVPVWSRGGILCTGETYKSVVKTDLRQGRRPRRPQKPLQLEPRGKHPKSHRHS